MPVDAPRILTAALRSRRIQSVSAIWLIPLLVAALALALPAAGEAAGTGSIAGTVTQEGGGPLSGVVVCAEGLEASASEGECIKTAFNGTYKITGLNEGEYLVYFSPPSGGNFVGRYYAESGEDATPVHVVGGATTPNSNEGRR
ncbi:MAG TPA: carboxypeptidase-like regulatory domain-containing protein [Solirubrobacterales bacterium]|jgi:hypothetical protein